MTREEKIKRNAIEYGLAIRDVMIMHGAKREPSETISKVVQMAYLTGAAEADANPTKLCKPKEETLCDKCRKEQPSHSCQDITTLGRCALEQERRLKSSLKLFT